MYSTENGEKFIVVERWNRTIKQRMWKQFTVQGNTQDLDILPQIVLKYNNTKHSSLKMTPTEASIKKNKGTVYFNLYDDIETSTKPKFKVGDKVRISKYKSKRFVKGYTPNWTEEMFIVDKVLYTNPITYKIKDLKNEVKRIILWTWIIASKTLSFQSLFGENIKRNMLRWSGKDMMMISTIGYQLRIWLILKKIVYERQKQKIISLISRHMKRRLK